MAYTINKTDGTIFATVQDGTIDNSTSSLVMVGKNYAGWGEALDENFVKLLESHSNPTAPTTPHKGQLWFNSSLGILTVYDGNAFKPLAASTPTDSQPAAADSVVGDMWYDTINSQLNIYDGDNFIVVGPSFTDTGTTGSVTEIMTDVVSVAHTVVKQYISSEVVAVISKDAAFQPIGTDQIPGFGTTIYPGIQLAETLTGEIPLFTGKASDSDSLGTFPASSYLRSDIADETAGALSIKDDAGLTVGALSEGTFGVTVGDVILKNQTATGDVIIASQATAVITINGTSDRAEITTPSGSVPAEIANVDYVDTEIGNIPVLDAGDIAIVDGGGYYTGGNTELALQEVGADIVTVNNTLALKGDINGQTFTSATLTSPIINSPTISTPIISTSVSGSAILDEDDMSSNSSTKLATQQSIRAYIDKNSGIYSGSVQANATVGFNYLPAGWSVSKGATGVYNITHNVTGLATTVNYRLNHMVCTGQNSTTHRLLQSVPIGPTTFQVIIENETGTRYDINFTFIAVFAEVRGGNVTV